MKNLSRDDCRFYHATQYFQMIITIFAVVTFLTCVG